MIQKNKSNNQSKLWENSVTQFGYMKMSSQWKWWVRWAWVIKDEIMQTENTGSNEPTEGKERGDFS